MKKLIALLALVLTLGGAYPAARAAGTVALTPLQAAEVLHELGLFNGTGTDSAGMPVYHLERVPTRNQAVIMLVRLLGGEREALAGRWEIPFADVVPNSLTARYIGWACAHGLTYGTSDTTYGGSEPVRANQYIAFVLRALGYVSGEDFTVASAGLFADSIGLTRGEYTANPGAFTRGDMALVSCYALDMLLKGSETRTLRDAVQAARTVPTPTPTPTPTPESVPETAESGDAENTPESEPEPAPSVTPVARPAPEDVKNQIIAAHIGAQESVGNALTALSNAVSGTAPAATVIAYLRAASAEFNNAAGSLEQAARLCGDYDDTQTVKGNLSELRRIFAGLSGTLASANNPQSALNAVSEKQKEAKPYEYAAMAEYSAWRGV